MTAGSYMYIGPQGIVHGTTITVMNAARKQLKARGIAGTRENMKRHALRDSRSWRDVRGAA